MIDGLFIGIDPGSSGGIAVVDHRPRWVADINVAGSTETDLLDFLREFKDRGPVHACLERVWSSPQMGVKSAFTFGRVFGQLRTSLVAVGIPFDEVTPQVWQKVMGCQVGKSRANGGASGGDKNITKQRAQELFPLVKFTHALADAVLLAEYCRCSRLGIRLEAAS